MEIALLVSSHMVDILASRLRDHGVDCTLVPPYAILIRCDTEAADPEDFFPGLAPDTCAKVMSALLGLSSSTLATQLFGSNASLAASPFHVQWDEGLHLHYPTITSMLYSQLPGPELRRCTLGQTQGGAWVLYRAQKDESSTTLKELNVSDIASVAKSIFVENDPSY